MENYYKTLIKSNKNVPKDTFPLLISSLKYCKRYKQKQEDPKISQVNIFKIHSVKFLSKVKNTCSKVEKVF